MTVIDDHHYLLKMWKLRPTEGRQVAHGRAVLSGNSKYVSEVRVHTFSRVPQCLSESEAGHKVQRMSHF